MHFPDPLEDFKEYASQAVHIRKLKARDAVERSLADELAEHIRRFQPSPELAARIPCPRLSSRHSSVLPHINKQP
ncbi:hypothetical protein [Geminisphaera colitermitum]|uniref:hypothetical protein n=1 Tax=Geminisphaera colitermitum TaxID=1148786 RepID=UPI00019652F1|nr:hypothetical protein [Geminisphaera colitermitum]